MANNLSPAAREFLRGCHKNDLQALQKYIEGGLFDVDVVFRGLTETVRYKNWDAFFLIFGFASVKFKTHPRRLQEMSEEVLWDIIAASTPDNASEVASVLEKIVPFCRRPKIATTLYAAAQKNKNGIFEQLLPHFIPDRITYETLFYISLENKNDVIQKLLFDCIDINKVRSTLCLAHEFQYNRNKDKTQSNIDRLEAMVLNQNLTHILESEASEAQTVRRKM